MQISVKTNQYANQENGKMGVATVSFGEEFKVRSINILRNKDGNLFVAMPSYKTKKVDEHENPIFQNICNPVTKEFREQLYSAILESYQKGKEVTIEIEELPKQLSVKATVIPFEGDGFTKGLARISINDSFVVNNISINESKEGNLYLSMPSKSAGRLDENGNPEYRDVCYPTTKEFRELMQSEILSAYESAREVAQSKPEQEAETPLVESKPSVVDDLQKKTKNVVQAKPKRKTKQEEVR